MFYSHKTAYRKSDMALYRKLELGKCTNQLYSTDSFLYYRSPLLSSLVSCQHSFFPQNQQLLLFLLPPNRGRQGRYAQCTKVIKAVGYVISSWSSCHSRECRKTNICFREGEKNVGDLQKTCSEFPSWKENFKIFSAVCLYK